MKPHHVTFLVGIVGGFALAVFAQSGNWPAVGLLLTGGIYLICRH